MDKYSGELTKEPTESKMVTELGELHRATEELLGHTERLESKLQGVLHASPKPEQADTPHEELPGRLEEIRVCRERVAAANYMLKSIMNRLEV